MSPAVESSQKSSAKQLSNSTRFSKGGTQHATLEVTREGLQARIGDGESVVARNRCRAIGVTSKKPSTKSFTFKKTERG
eukprot:729203-Amphidinium_carterae.1